MDEKELKKIISESEISPASSAAREKAADAAWAILQSKKARKERKKTFYFGASLKYRLAGGFASLMAVGLIFTGIYEYSSPRAHKDASSETNLINSSQITQYPAGVRTSVVRMVLRGQNVHELRFNQPENTQSLLDRTRGVFLPEGGNATYTLPPTDILEKADARWHFNREVQIVGLKSTNPDTTDANELTAWLPGVKEYVCKKINAQLGIAGIPNVAISLAVLQRDMINQEYTPLAATQINAQELQSQPFGCFRSKPENVYVYYHVIIEG